MKQLIKGTLEGVTKVIEVEDGLITDIRDNGTIATVGSELVDTSGTLLPGYIDIHVHGGGGADTMDASEDAFEQIAATHAKHGTTALLLTTITERADHIEKSLTAFRPDRKRDGAEIIGFHLEGPFIHMDKAGAQPKEFIQAPNVELLSRWMKLSGNAIRYITVAPDVNGADELIKACRRMGIIVSAGHSSATFQQAKESFVWGVQSATHLFNAMTGLHHRDPGLVGAVFDSDDIYAELIADKIHVNSAVMKIIFRMKGTDKVMLITDAIRAACMPEGQQYTLGNQIVTVKNGTVRLLDGTIAGSVLTLDKAVKNLLNLGILQKEDVIPVTSANQSRLLNLPFGQIRVGSPANIISIDDGWDVTHTFVRGNLVYRK